MIIENLANAIKKIHWRQLQKKNIILKWKRLTKYFTFLHFSSSSKSHSSVNSVKKCLYDIDIDDVGAFSRFMIMFMFILLFIAYSVLFYPSASICSIFEKSLFFNLFMLLIAYMFNVVFYFPIMLLSSLKK